MRIHLVSNLFPPDVLGGYELLAADVARGLQERGHEVTVVTTGGGAISLAPPGTGVRVERILRLSRPFGSEARRDRLRHLFAAVMNRHAVRRLVDLEGVPDAVLVMSLRRMGLEPIRAYAGSGVRPVFTVNDDWPVAFVPTRRGIGGLLDAAPWARGTWRDIEVQRVVYLSDAIRRMVREAGAPMPHGRVQPQGVRLADFPPRPFRPIAASPSLLFVGRLHPTKAPEVAIDTLADLRKHGITATLDVAGKPADEAYGASLRARAERAGVSAAITWHGLVPRDHLPQLFARCDALLFPCAWEGEAQGLTYMEAMASGLLVVAFPRGGAREILDEHPVAARASENSGEAFAKTIVALLGDVPRQRGLVEGGLRAFREQVSLDRYIEVLEEELLAASRRTPIARGSSHAGKHSVFGI
jgi:glycosyltransferase involved in cell wall biosynthesis